MTYTVAQKNEIYKNIEKYKENYEILLNIVAYILDGDPRDKTRISGVKGIQKFNADKVNEIKFNYLDAWFSGLNDGEIDYDRLDKVQRHRFDEIRTLFEEAYFAKKSGSISAERPEEKRLSRRASREQAQTAATDAATTVSKMTPPPVPPRPLPATPLSSLSQHRQEKRGSKREMTEPAVEEVPQDIAEKNARIRSLIEKRRDEIKKDWVKGAAHHDRKFALGEILAYVQTHYHDNTRVIDLEDIENVLKEQFKSDPQKLKSFEEGTSRNPSVIYSKKEKSEYAKLKEETKSIKDSNLSAESAQRKKW